MARALPLIAASTDDRLAYAATELAEVLVGPTFPDEAAKAAFHADPAHTEVEQKLYPVATEHVVWLTGHAIS